MYLPDVTIIQELSLEYEKKGVRPQSRQSAKRFSSRWNWDSPTPLAAGECAPPPFGPGGRADSLAAKGVGSPNSNEGTYTVVLYIYKYFVVYRMYRSIFPLIYSTCAEPRFGLDQLLPSAIGQ